MDLSGALRVQHSLERGAACSIGGKADPLRLIFTTNTGPAIGAFMIDLGKRFRLVAIVVDVVPMDAPLPKLPVARALWLSRPSLKTAAAA